MSFLKWCWTEAGDKAVFVVLSDPFALLCWISHVWFILHLQGLGEGQENQASQFAKGDGEASENHSTWWGLCGKAGHTFSWSFRVVFCNKSPLGKGKRYASQVKCRCSGWFPKSRVYDGWRISAACNPSQPWLLTAHLLGRFGAKASHAAQALLQHM